MYCSQTVESCRWPCRRPPTKDFGDPQGKLQSDWRILSASNFGVLQSYGLADKVFEKGCQMHMAVRLSLSLHTISGSIKTLNRLSIIPVPTGASRYMIITYILDSRIALTCSLFRDEL
jgi:hypothetical protein